MNQNPDANFSWRCRACGSSNPLKIRSCQKDSCSGVRTPIDVNALQSVLSETVLTQIFEPTLSEGMTSNHGSDISVEEYDRQIFEKWMGPIQEQSQEPALSAPGRGFAYWFFRTITCICLTIATLVMVLIFSIIVAGIMKAMRMI